VNYIILPLAKRLMRPEQATKASSEGYLAGTVLHEISHGLGPSWARLHPNEPTPGPPHSPSAGVPNEPDSGSLGWLGEGGDRTPGTDGQQVSIREAIGPLYSALEEAKADVVGMLALNWLMDQGVLPQEKREEYYVSYVADLFRTVRFGLAEAHGRAEMMEFNYLNEQKVIVRDAATGRYSVESAKLPAAMRALAQELLETEAGGDRARAEAWFKKYQAMPPELAEKLKSITDIPVDLAPIYSFPVNVE
jgi:hypothetical protein